MPADKRPFLLALVSCLFVVLPGAVPECRGQEPPAPQAKLTLERLLDSSEFHGDHAGPIQWLEGGAGYLEIARAKEGGGQQIVLHRPATGQSEVLVPPSKLTPGGAKKPLEIDELAVAKGGRKFLVFTNTRKVWRANTRGDYWVLDLDAGSLKKLGGKSVEASLMFATFDPEGRRVAYVHENNLCVEDLADGTIVRLTQDGSATRINGTFDWVYEEELSLRNGFRWSPDGRSIAYWQIDDSGVPEYPLLDASVRPYPKVVPVRYPKTGQKNPAARIGVVAASGGPTTWLKLDGDPREHYLARMDWIPGTSELLIQRLNRKQNELRVLVGDASSGMVRPLFTDRDDAWVDVQDDLKWFDHGRAFTWTADRDGWRRLEVVRPREGSSPRRLATGDLDVIEVLFADPDGEYVDFLASPENPTQRYLYRLRVHSEGKPVRLTPADQPGTHSYQHSPDGRWAVHTCSSLGNPPVTEIVSLPDHRAVRTITDNAKLRAKVQALEGNRGEFFRVDVGEGVLLDGWCLKPPGFDPSKRYPVLVHVYGEPAAQSVLDRWGGESYLWHRMLAQRGYVVLSMDNRGTPAPRGRDWRKCVYRQVGILAPKDQARAMKALLEKWPFLDRDRVGIWGWSGGGSMTLDCIFRYPELYRTGIAVAFVADQRLYDTIYQERYMDLPSDNPEGYKQGSPITHAGGLKGKLLLIHGTGDDNVHVQNLEVLVNRLVELNKPFSMMAYPGRTHSISEGPGTRRHLYELMTRFLEENLPPGPR
ncbi:MAG: S9 family peptidase [Isosphaeraceae bacterium]